MLSMGDENIAKGAVLRSELKALTEEMTDMNRYRDYFDGEQALVFSTDKFHEVFGDAFAGFKDNWMKVIVNALNHRLKVINFHFEDDDTNEIAEDVWRTLRLNDFVLEQKDLHEGALVEGRAFVIVWPDEVKGATVDWQPGQLCRIFYNPENRKEKMWAVRRWMGDTGDIYVTFYTPDFVYKYIDKSGAVNPDQRSSKDALTEVPGVGSFAGTLEKRQSPGDPTWPLPNPYAPYIPVIEYNNANYDSEIKDHIPQQDALNKTLLDSMITGEFQAFPQRLVETSSNEPEGGWFAGPGEIWHFKPSFDSDGKQISTQFKSFETSDPSTYIKMVEMWLQHMALTSSTPVRMFHQSDRGGRGDAPSGDSLVVDDKPLNDKVEDRQDRFGVSHLEMARFIASSLGYEDAFTLIGEAVWRDPRFDQRLIKLEEGKAMAEAGFPVKFIATQVGFTPEEEALLLKLLDEQQAELDAQTQAETAQSNDQTDSAT